jgi:formylglycine-generating enzyme required for sulfatase activity
MREKNQAMNVFVRGAALAVPLCMATASWAIVNFDWATIGNPGNPADTLQMTKGPVPDYTSGYGSVGYVYRVSKYDVTNTQYTAFLNAVDPAGTNSLKLYDTRMGSNPLLANGTGGLAYQGGILFNASAPAGSKYSVASGQGNRPATWIYYNAGCRFVNWLVNGQGSGGTETGAYTMPASLSDQTVVRRNAGAQIFIPSEDEFYKAAYYDPTKNGTGGYWQYGVRTDNDPVSEGPAGGPNSANIAINTTSDYGHFLKYWQTNGSFNPSVDYLTNVGAYTNATSYYGLYDTEGLLSQWTEGIKMIGSNSFPVYRGGSWYYGPLYAGAGLRNLYSFANVAAYATFGLRVASLPPPAITATWNVNSAGNWGDGGNWTGGAAPDSQDASATFGPVITLARSVSLGSPRTVGSLTFNSSASYTLTGSASAPLALSASTGNATVTVSTGNHTISAPVTLASNTTFTIASSSTLSINSTVSGTGSLTLASGRLNVDTYTAGTISISPGATLAIGKGGVVSSMSYASLVTLAQQGRLVGNANGDLRAPYARLAIFDNDIADNLGTNAGVAYYPTFLGQSAPAAGTLLFYTYTADLNLDGIVDGRDYKLMLAGFMVPPTPGTATWLNGDLNYDRQVDSSDFSLFLTSYSNYTTPFASPTGDGAATTVIPEPGLLSLTALAPLALPRRRR